MTSSPQVDPVSCNVQLLFCKIVNDCIFKQKSFNNFHLPLVIAEHSFCFLALYIEAPQKTNISGSNKTRVIETLIIRNAHVNLRK